MGQKATYGEAIKELMKLLEQIIEMNSVYREAYVKKVMSRKDFFEHLELQDESIKEIAAAVKTLAAEWTIETEAKLWQ